MPFRSGNSLSSLRSRIFHWQRLLQKRMRHEECDTHGNWIVRRRKLEDAPLSLAPDEFNVLDLRDLLDIIAPQGVGIAGPSSYALHKLRAEWEQESRRLRHEATRKHPPESLVLYAQGEAYEKAALALQQLLLSQESQEDP